MRHNVRDNEAEAAVGSGDGAMQATLLNGWNAFWLDANAINVVSIIAGGLAGFFGYQFLSGRGGPLRQFIVGLVAGLAYGAFYYVIDWQTGFTYSNTIRQLFGASTSAGPSPLFPLAGGVFAFIVPFIDPNVYRSNEDRLPRWHRSVAAVAHGIATFGLSFVCLTVDVERLGWLRDNHLSVVVVTIASLAIGALDGLAVATNVLDRLVVLGVPDAPGEGASIEEQQAYLSQLTHRAPAIISKIALFGLIMVVVALIVILQFAYAISVMGWLFGLDAVGFVVAVAGLIWIQARADRLGTPHVPSKRPPTPQEVEAANQRAAEYFLQWSFAFFVIALLLQIYSNVFLANK